MTLQEFVAKCMTYNYRNRTERIIYVFEVGELPDDDIGKEIKDIKDTLSGEGGTMLSLTIHGERNVSAYLKQPWLDAEVEHIYCIDTNTIAVVVNAKWFDEKIKECSE